MPKTRDVSDAAKEDTVLQDDHGISAQRFVSLSEVTKRTKWIALTSRKTIVICISILLYFGLVVIIYSAVEGWDFMECIYFAVVVVTTVGYGDYLPTTDGSRMATIFLCHFALAIVAFAIGHFVDLMKQQWLNMLKLSKDGHGLLDLDAARIHRRYRTFIALLAYLATLIVGTIVFALCIDWDEEFPDDAGSKWVNALYLTVITVTTIGFGDFTAAATPGLQVFACVLMLFGIPSAVTVLALGTEMIFGEMQQDVELRVVKDGMTQEKFDQLNSFVEKLRSGGIGNYRKQGAKQISRFEYLCFVLVRNGVINVKNIESVMKNFDDVSARQPTSSDFLCYDDSKVHNTADISTMYTPVDDFKMGTDLLPGSCPDSMGDKS